MILYIYLIGVLFAYATLMYAIRRHGSNTLFLFIPKERVIYLSLLSWLIVLGLIAAWLYDIITYLYAYLLFKYLLWRAKRNNKSGCPHGWPPPFFLLTNFKRMNQKLYPAPKPIPGWTPLGVRYKPPCKPKVHFFFLVIVVVILLVIILLLTKILSNEAW